MWSALGVRSTRTARAQELLSASIIAFVDEFQGNLVPMLGPNGVVFLIRAWQRVFRVLWGGSLF